MATQPHVTEDVDLARLQAIYEQLFPENLPATEFVRAIERIDWDTKNAKAFDEAIRMAISLDATRLAEHLANRGHELYPENDTLARAARIFGPPRVLARNLPPAPGLRDSTLWLKEHRREYLNQWIALKGSQLIGSAATRAELLRMIEPVSRADNVLVIRVD